MKVLHVVESMHFGAVENWLARMLRYGKRQGFDLDWTFYCTLARAGALDAEVRSLGARILYSPVPIGDKLAFMRALRTELKDGAYDVLHCHHDLVSAVYLMSSIGLPIKRRLVHVHNADENVLTHNRLKQRLLREPMRVGCLRLADRVVGISNHTLDSFLAGRPRRSDRDVVHYYGVDEKPFTTIEADRVGFRRKHGLADDALILLFAGRVVSEKNPAFAVDVLASLRRLRPQAVLIFAGSGSQEQVVLERAHALGVADSTRLLGWRHDLPYIMLCCDWFILPRPELPMEGLGLAVIEAQLAGLRLLLSTGIPDDPLLPTANVVRLPLTAGLEVWVRGATDLLMQPRPSREAAVAALARSPFNMEFALRELLIMVN